MQQIADWLQKLDLGEYTERFVENKIDISVLPHITDQDLNDIGIPLGHRRKILRPSTRGPRRYSQLPRRPEALSRRRKTRPSAATSLCFSLTGRLNGVVRADGS